MAAKEEQEKIRGTIVGENGDDILFNQYRERAPYWIEQMWSKEAAEQRNREIARIGEEAYKQKVAERDAAEMNRNAELHQCAPPHHHRAYQMDFSMSKAGVFSFGYQYRGDPYDNEARKMMLEFEKGERELPYERVQRVSADWMEQHFRFDVIVD